MVHGVGQSPSRNRFWCILTLKSDNDFNDESSNELPKFHPFSSRLREFSFKAAQFEI